LYGSYCVTTVEAAPIYAPKHAARWIAFGTYYGMFPKEFALESVFQSAATLMLPDATIYVCTDAREFTKKATEEALRDAFPEKRMEIRSAPYKQATQTALFGDTASKPGEVDFILR